MDSQFPRPTVPPVPGSFFSRRGPLALLLLGSITLVTGHTTPSVAAKPETGIRPFTIQIDQAVLDDLQRRLELTRFPDQVEDAGWAYGANLGYMRKLVSYWRNNYDWRKHERSLNTLHHFKTRIDGLDLHFVHERSRHKNAFPLVLVHGWPGSFCEFQKIVGMLTDPTAHGGKAEDAFHVVIPSLPGFGFSDRPRTRGWNNTRMAETIAKLMKRLGYTRYGSQGGDWGASISSWLGRNDSEHCVGIHLNFVSGRSARNASKPYEGLTADEIRRVRDRSRFMTNEGGYNQIQSTKPQTLGFGLNDSPAGLAAWIIEKFRTWSDCDGDLDSRYTKDELLTNVMTYWVTQTITSSTRIYYETRHFPARGRRGRVAVPVGCAIFPHEIVYAPRRWVETRYNVTHWTKMPRGGHFAAMEEPKLLAEDIRAFFGTIR